MDYRSDDSQAILQLANRQQLLQMYDLLPDVMFWVKNLACQFIYANRAFLQHVGAAHRREILGKSDLDFSPSHLAQQYLADDQRVLKGDVVTDRLELNLDDDGDLAWFTTSKRPLLDDKGVIVGSFGITRHLEKTVAALSEMQAIKAPVSFIREHYADNITLAHIADQAHLSVSALERRFRKLLGKTPLQVLIDVRLEHARRLLYESVLPIGEVAYRCGFKDASYFGRRFKRKFGLLPSEYRAQL